MGCPARPGILAWLVGTSPIPLTARRADARSVAVLGRSGGVAADLELHPVGVAEEQRPLPPQPLDLAPLAAGRHDAVPHALEHLERRHGEGEVVDRAPPALTAPLPDDLLRR